MQPRVKGREVDILDITLPLIRDLTVNVITHRSPDMGHHNISMGCNIAFVSRPDSEKGKVCKPLNPSSKPLSSTVNSEQVVLMLTEFGFVNLDNS